MWHVAHAIGSSLHGRPPTQQPTPHAILRHSPPSYVYAARFHPIAPGIIVSGAYDRGVRLWDARLPPPSVIAAADAAAEDATTALVVDPATAALTATLVEGAFLGFIGAPVGPAASVAQYDPALGEDGRHHGFVNAVEFDAPSVAPESASAATKQYTGASFAPRRLFTADSAGVIFVWAARSDAPRRPDAYTVLRKMCPGIFRGVPIVAVRARPGGADQLLAVGHSNVVRLFDLTTYAPVRGFPGGRCAASRVDAVFSPDGRYIAAGSEDGALTLWEADTGVVVHAQASVGGGARADIAFPSAMFGVAWHPSQHIVAVTSFGGSFPVMLCGALSRPAAALRASGPVVSSGGATGSGGSVAAVAT